MTNVHPEVLASLPSLPFFQQFRIEVMSAAVGHVVLRMPLESDQPAARGGVIPGAFLAAFVDVTAATTVRVSRGAGDPPFRLIGAVDAMISYLAPCRGDAIAEGRVLRSGGSLVFTEVTITTPDGALTIAAHVTEAVAREP